MDPAFEKVDHPGLSTGVGLKIRLQAFGLRLGWKGRISRERKVSLPWRRARV